MGEPLSSPFMLASIVSVICGYLCVASPPTVMAGGGLDSVIMRVALMWVVWLCEVN